MIHAKFALFSPRCPHCSSIDFRSGNTRNAIETSDRWDRVTLKEMVFHP